MNPFSNYVLARTKSIFGSGSGRGASSPVRQFSGPGAAGGKRYQYDLYLALLAQGYSPAEAQAILMKRIQDLIGPPIPFGRITYS